MEGRGGEVRPPKEERILFVGDVTSVFISHYALAARVTFAISSLVHCSIELGKKVGIHCSIQKEFVVTFITWAPRGRAWQIRTLEHVREGFALNGDSQVAPLVESIDGPLRSPEGEIADSLSDGHFQRDQISRFLVVDAALK